MRRLANGNVAHGCEMCDGEDECTCRPAAASVGYDLKPCPFCGGKAKITDRGEGRLQISCEGCRAYYGQAWSRDETHEILTAGWNKRS